MNGWEQFLVAVALAAAPAGAQPVPPQPPQPPAAPLAPVSPFFQREMSDIDMKMAAARAAMDLIPDVTGLKSTMAALQSQGGLTLFQARARSGSGKLDAEYDNGTRALDDHKYEEAVSRFDSVIQGKSPRADGALYWKAYALNRIGQRDGALAALTALRRDFPNSHWLNDAQALEAEVRQGSGQAVSPAQETNEDLKLMAINSLMRADPERAMPLLEGLLKGNSAPRVKDRAMFVLTQNRSPRAQQILNEYAKGAGNPDLQLRAIRYIGMSGTADAPQQLASIYSGSNDTGVKREIIRALMISKGRDPLFNLAKSEKDEELRSEVIRQLGEMRATDQLSQLYASETSTDNKVAIVRSLFVAGASDKLLDLVKNEKDPKVRSEAVRSLSMARSTSPETLAGLYASDADPKTKRDIVNGLHSRGDAKLLVDLARKENDPTMKKYIVERLSGMRSKEATDYMMELLK